MNKEKLTSETIRLISVKLKAAMLNLVYDICYRHDEEVAKNDLDSFGFKAEGMVEEYTHDLVEMLNATSEERAEKLKELSETILTFGEKYAPLYLYQEILERNIDYSQWLMTYTAPQEFSSEEYKASLSFINGYLHDFVNKPKNDYDKHINMSKVFSCLPMRLTRQIFSDELEKGLKELFADKPDFIKSGLAREFFTMHFPQSVKSYSSVMPELAKEIEQYCNLSIDKLPLDDQEEHLDSLNMLMDRVVDYCDYYNSIYNDLNYLYLLYTFAHDFEFVTGGNVNIEDIVYTCREMINTGDFDLYCESLEEKISDILSYGDQEVEKLEEALKKQVKPEKVTEEEPLGQALNVYLYICETYNRELSNAYCKDMEWDLSTDEKVDEFIKEIVELTNNSPLELSPIKNKYMRREMMVGVPLVMSDNDFTAYFNRAMDISASYGAAHTLALDELIKLLIVEKAMPQDLINMLIGEDEHHHDHDCGCGHDHHHDHDCGCGHDHHHDHDCDCGHDHHHDHDHDCNCGHDHHHDHDCGCGHDHHHDQDCDCGHDHHHNHDCDCGHDHHNDHDCGCGHNNNHKH